MGTERPHTRAKEDHAEYRTFTKKPKQANTKRGAKASHPRFI